VHPNTPFLLRFLSHTRPTYEAIVQLEEKNRQRKSEKIKDTKYRKKPGKSKRTGRMITTKAIMRPVCFYARYIGSN